MNVVVKSRDISGSILGPKDGQIYGNGNALIALFCLTLNGPYHFVVVVFFISAFGLFLSPTSGNSTRGDGLNQRL